ncbi:MAG: DUF2273 domain-containing protein [Clostridia bacterium]|nr:DUF2273 domain-containing protein [Clostridia bacterium]
MKKFQRGTTEFGFLIGMLFVVLGILFMTIGVWKTILLAVLFAIGFFLGAVGDPAGAVKKTINKVVPEKKPEVINFREELAKEQEAAMQRSEETEKGNLGKEEDGE